VEEGSRVAVMMIEEEDRTYCENKSPHKGVEHEVAGKLLSTLVLGICTTGWSHCVMSDH
jgi:hypothetical protein